MCRAFTVYIIALYLHKVNKNQLLFCHGKADGDLGACAFLGEEADLCLVVCCGMLYYGESEACAAYLLGAAFVNAVESLEDSVLLVAGDAYSVVLHRDAGAFSVSAHSDLHKTAACVVFYCIVGKVIDDLIDDLLCAENIFVASRHGERHTCRLCDIL